VLHHRIPRRSIVAVATLLALVPATAAHAAEGVDPSTVNLAMKPGEQTTLTKKVTTPKILPRPDIYFLADTTGSMQPVINNVKANAGTILSAVDAQANDPRYGAGQYKDFQSPRQSDPFAFRNDSSIGTAAAAHAAINGWSASGGFDIAEANLYALHKLVTAAGFRADSSRIVVWFGDAPGHDPVCTAISGEAANITEASVTAELVAAGVKVIAVSTTTGTPGGLNANPVPLSSDYNAACGAPGGLAGQGNRISAATGGTAFSDVPPGDVADAILAGLTALPVTVTPVVTCDPGLSVTFDVPSKTVTSGEVATFQETIKVAADATSGVKKCTVDFKLNGQSAGPAFVEKNTVTVNRPPNCANATASPGELWPPNHKFRTITVGGVTDPDGDPVTVTITGVTQDEALNGTGDGDTAPDAAWVTGHRDQVQVRSERSGQGDGRVYRISFTGSDGKDTCTGTVYVGVPHDRSGPPAVDTTSVVVNSFGS
jgi:von Willebrand factor type A domain